MSDANCFPKFDFAKFEQNLKLKKLSSTKSEEILRNIEISIDFLNRLKKSIINFNEDYIEKYIKNIFEEKGEMFDRLEAYFRSQEEKNPYIKEEIISYIRDNIISIESLLRPIVDLHSKIINHEDDLIPNELLFLILKKEFLSEVDVICYRYCI